MPQLSDRELVENFRNGDIKGFNELVRRYQQKVYWIARRTLGSHEDADDVVQEVFVRVYEGLKHFRGESTLYTWLYRITFNLSVNTLRKKRLKDFLPFDQVAETLLPSHTQSDGPVASAEYEQILERAVERLPPKQKMVFVMRYFEEMPYDEMAKILKKSVGGLKANYFHALKKISRYVKREMEL
jgi:RNA polymerase sigma-70 factor (ECF subfamily)